jgi:hypothetical protein
MDIIFDDLLIHDFSARESRIYIKGIEMDDVLNCAT